MTKICKKCGEEKSLEEFPTHSKDKLRNICKYCYSEENKNRYLKNKDAHSKRCKYYHIKNKDKIKIKNKEYSEKNSEALKEKNKKYREENKEKIKEHRKKYYNENIDKVKVKNKKYREENKEKLRIKNKEYRDNNKEKYKEKREKNKEKISKNFKDYYNEHKDYFIEHRKRYHESEKGKAQKLKWCNEYNSKNKHVVLWRSLLRRMIVQLKTDKTDKTESMLGYSAMDLKIHIENNWLSGMTWENYGEWHVDHIRSVATFESTDLPSVVNALSNLQPMWATSRTIDGIFYEGNLNKGKKYD